jgi:hypothetical protein
MARTITFNELRALKDKLPDGSIRKIAQDLDPFYFYKKFLIEILNNLNTRFKTKSEVAISTYYFKNPSTTKAILHLITKKWGTYLL